MTFRQHRRQRTVSALGELTGGPVSDVYAVTFRIDSVDQDPRFPYLALGCTTEDEPARLLHTEGDLVHVLGRPVPVLHYDMSGPEAMSALTRAANPPESAADFLAGDEPSAPHSAAAVTYPSSPGTSGLSGA
ncbi:hypothetical protein [Streptomyces qinglanensis]|uniref:hypothetical protein n=1 Tax=Streptomyces qinglanensis TaxID=943816 RepID=UPI003D710200